MGFLDRITGKTGAQAATQSAQVQADATKAAAALLDPFKGIGQQGLDLAGFLTDPNAQFEFLQNNPLFQASLDNANRVTNRSAAATGRLSAGDTLLDLSNNFLTSAFPLIQDQKNSIGDLLNFGLNTASNQGSLRVGEGAALAGGIVGAENAKANGYKQIIDLGSSIAGLFAASDPRLKTNVRKIDERNGYNIYAWDWNKLAAKLGLSGSGMGVMADEVARKNPRAVSLRGGYMHVDYSQLGLAL